MIKSQLTGLVAATHTPFTADGSLNLAIVEKQAAHSPARRHRPPSSAAPPAKATRSPSRSAAQLTQRWWKSPAARPCEVVVHVGSNCLADARALAAQAQQLGRRRHRALAP